MGNLSNDSQHFHGECKSPGGKLVVVEFRLREGLLFDVAISGDFFLFPDETLNRLCAGLEGAPGSASIDQLAARVQYSLASEDELVGVTPHAVAIAVERAMAENR
jgi:lipoate-protein ligase A